MIRSNQNKKINFQRLRNLLQVVPFYLASVAKAPFYSFPKPIKIFYIFSVMVSKIKASEPATALYH